MSTATLRARPGLLRNLALVALLAAGLFVLGVMEVSFDIGAGALGAFTGLTYGLLAVGLVLVFRSSRFINFAHGDIGFFGAAVMLTLVLQAGVPYWIGFLGGVLAGALAGALTETAVVRRLEGAPKLMSMVATLILGRVLLGLSLTINSQAATGYLYPQPAGFGEFEIGALRATGAHGAMLVLTPIVAVALIMFLRRSRFGMAIRAAATNPDAASMAGMAPRRLATATWALAGGIAAFTAILWLPTRVLAVGQFGPSLLVRALAAAVIARMESLPIAFAAGIALGVAEQVVAFNASGGVIEAVLFLVILVTLLLQSRRGSREEESGSWAAVQPWPALPRNLARLRSVRLTRTAGWAVLFGGALAVWPWLTNEQAFVAQIAMAFILVGVSIGIVTGMAGQLSLGQFAIAGVGAVVAYHVAAGTGSVFLAFAGAALSGALTAVLVGLPALRLRGLLLAVTTLSFAVAGQGWLFGQSWAFGGGVSSPQLRLLGIDIVNNRAYYGVALGVVAVGLLLARNVRGSAFGRALVALRDNEDAARAFTIPATARKLQAFGISGVIAGLGGALYAFAVQNIESGLFESQYSIDVIALTLIGGVAVLAGPIIGALYLVVIPLLADFGHAGTGLHLLLALLVILALPNGAVALLRPVRERWVAWLSRRSGVEAEAAETPTAAVRLDVRDRDSGQGRGVDGERSSGDDPLLEVREIRKSYGGVTAVSGISFTVAPGETLGLIGPNGAGKTTLFEMISGFVRPDEGAVWFAGTDVTRLGPEVRGKAGLIRSFQEASLFPTMTLLDTVRAAHERAVPGGFGRAVLGIDPAERHREERARELISLMGLDGFRDKPVGELSTGVRRLSEITCLLALEPRLLLLDEPAAGVAQRETEQLGGLLRQVKEHLDTTLIVIEHDLPLINEISDRVIAMDVGKILAEGTPAQVQADPRVADAFLGGSLEAIARSGAVPATDPDQLTTT
jgi:ABC-type branched-subunit amino acid transport system ATPase component/ABC-type branched-subunit amino acid transport system permease subunit